MQDCRQGRRLNADAPVPLTRSIYWCNCTRCCHHHTIHHAIPRHWCWQRQIRWWVRGRIGWPGRAPQAVWRMVCCAECSVLCVVCCVWCGGAVYAVRCRVCCVLCVVSWCGGVVVLRAVWCVVCTLCDELSGVCCVVCVLCDVRCVVCYLLLCVADVVGCCTIGVSTCCLVGGKWKA